MSWHGDTHITHKMRDGRILEDVQGMVVPFNEHFAGVYDLLARHAIKRALAQANEQKEEENT